MRSITKKAVVLAAALVMAVGTVGCGKKHDSGSSKTSGKELIEGNVNGVDMKEDDMPYGSTMVKLTDKENSVPIDIEYDRRFIKEEEAKVVSSFFDAINEKNADELKQAVYEPFAATYASIKGASDLKMLVEGLYNSISQILEDDFKINYLIIESMPEVTSISYDSFIKDAVPEAKIDDCRMISLEIYYTSEKKSGLLNKMVEGGEIQYFLYTIDGKPYIIG